MGIVRSDDYGEYFPESDDYGGYFSEKPRKIVKLEKWNSLVIVAGGDLAEIRPLLPLPRNGEISKMGITRSDDSGKYFPESDDYGQYFSGKARKS